MEELDEVALFCNFLFPHQNKAQASGGIILLISTSRLDELSIIFPIVSRKAVDGNKIFERLYFSRKKNENLSFIGKYKTINKIIWLIFEIFIPYQIRTYHWEMMIGWFILKLSSNHILVWSLITILTNFA